VIVAAGRGTRFGRPKQLVELDGRPMLGWSIDTFASMPEIPSIVIVTEPEFIAQVEALARPLVRSASLAVVAGGADRQASSSNGVAHVPEHCDGIFAPVVDTIKIVDGERKVTRTLDRATLWAAQTPQFATARDFRRAHAEAVRHAWPRATDDAALLERAGLDVVVVEASPENIKVTHPTDLARAETMMRERALGPAPAERAR
jgi:2-C-methyl-D-erythritol 4-phosphate cytidylyltransferase